MKAVDEDDNGEKKEVDKHSSQSHANSRNVKKGNKEKEEKNKRANISREHSVRFGLRKKSDDVVIGKKEKRFPPAALVCPWWGEQGSGGGEVLGKSAGQSQMNKISAGFGGDGRGGFSVLSTPSPCDSSSQSLRYSFSPACLGWRCPSCGEVEIEKMFWQNEIEAAHGRKQEMYELYARVATLRMRTVEHSKGQGKCENGVEATRAVIPSNNSTKSSSKRRSTGMSLFSSRWNFLINELASSPRQAKLLFRPAPPPSTRQITRKIRKERAQVISRECQDCFLCPRCSGIPIAVQSDILSYPSSFSSYPTTISPLPTSLPSFTIMSSRYSLCGIRLRLCMHTGQLYFSCPYCDWCSASGEEEEERQRRRTQEEESAHIQQVELEGERMEKQRNSSRRESLSPLLIKNDVAVSLQSAATATTTTATGEWMRPREKALHEEVEDRVRGAGTEKGKGFVSLDALQTHCQEWSNAARLRGSFAWWKGRVALYGILCPLKSSWTVGLGAMDRGHACGEGGNDPSPHPHSQLHSGSSLSASYGYSVAEEVDQFLAWKRLHWGSPFYYANSAFAGEEKRRLLREQMEMHGQRGGGSGGGGGKSGWLQGVGSLPSMHQYNGQQPRSTASRKIWEWFLLLDTVSRQLIDGGKDSERALVKYLVEFHNWNDKAGGGGATNMISGDNNTKRKMQKNENADHFFCATSQRGEGKEESNNNGGPKGEPSVLQWVKLLQQSHPAVLMDFLHETFRAQHTEGLKTLYRWSPLSGMVQAMPSDQHYTSSTASHTSICSSATSSFSSFTLSAVRQLSLELGPPPPRATSFTCTLSPSTCISSEEFHVAPFCSAVKAKDYYKAILEEAHQRLGRRKEKGEKQENEHFQDKNWTERREEKLLRVKQKPLPSLYDCFSSEGKEMVEAELYVASQALYVGVSPTQTLPLLLPPPCLSSSFSSSAVSLSSPQQKNDLKAEKKQKDEKQVKKESTGEAEKNSKSPPLRIRHASYTLSGDWPPTRDHHKDGGGNSYSPLLLSPAHETSSSLCRHCCPPLVVNYGLPSPPKQLITAMVCRIEVPHYLLLWEVLHRVMRQFPDPPITEEETEEKGKREGETRTTTTIEDTENTLNEEEETVGPRSPPSLSSLSSTASRLSVVGSRVHSLFSLAFPIKKQMEKSGDKRKETNQDEKKREGKRKLIRQQQLGGSSSLSSWWWWKVLERGSHCYRNSGSRFLLLLDGQQDEEISLIQQYWNECYANTEKDEEDEKERRRRRESEKENSLSHSSTKEELPPSLFSSSSSISVSSFSTLPLPQSGARKSTTFVSSNQEDAEKKKEDDDGEEKPALKKREKDTTGGEKKSSSGGASSLQLLLSGDRVTAATILPFVEAQWERSSTNSGGEDGVTTPGVSSTPNTSGKKKMTSTTTSLTAESPLVSSSPPTGLSSTPSSIEEFSSPALPPPPSPSFPVLRISFCNLSAEDVFLSSVTLTQLATQPSRQASEGDTCRKNGQPQGEEERGEEEKNEMDWALYGEDRWAQHLLLRGDPQRASPYDTTSDKEVLLLPRGGYLAHSMRGEVEDNNTPVPLEEEYAEEEEEIEEPWMTDCLSWTLRPQWKGRRVESCPTTTAIPITTTQPKKKVVPPPLRWIGLTIKARVSLSIKLLHSLRIMFSSIFLLPASSSTSPASTPSSFAPVTNKREYPQEDDEETVDGVTVSGGCIFSSSPTKIKSCFYASSPPQPWYEVEYGVVLAI